jgi:hypothetical protein
MNTTTLFAAELETETKEIEINKAGSSEFRELLDAELLYVGGGSGEVIIG